MSRTVLHFGPQHPSGAGLLHMLVSFDGDIVEKVEVDPGFLHRAFEKRAEDRQFFQFIPISNKIDYVGTIAWEGLWVAAVEKAMSVEPPKRAQYIRVIALEMQRIISHLLFLGAFGSDLGQFTIFLWAFREREPFMNLLEELTGGRLLCNYFRFGGVDTDLPPNFLQKLSKAIDELVRKIPEAEGLCEDNRIFSERTKGIGIISKQLAMDFQLCGPVLRGSGVNYDVRKIDPYLVYPEIKFDAIVENGGDCFARYKVRVREIHESIKIIKQAVSQIPDGPFNIYPGTSQQRMVKYWMLKIPPKEVFTRYENPKGEGSIYLVTDGGKNAYRAKLRSASFNNLQILPEICRGVKIADLPALVGSLDLVFGEVDR